MTASRRRERDVASVGSCIGKREGAAWRGVQHGALLVRFVKEGHSLTRSLTREKQLLKYSAQIIDFSREERRTRRAARGPACLRLPPSGAARDARKVHALY